MLIVALVMAIIALAALVTAVVTGNGVITWVCLAAGVIGVVLLIVDTLRARQQRDTQSAATADEGGFASDADYPDALPALDSPVRGGDHEVQREIIREERVIHPDTGFCNPDLTKEEVYEAYGGHRPRHRSTHRSSRKEV